MKYAGYGFRFTANGKYFAAICRIQGEERASVAYVWETGTGSCVRALNLDYAADVIDIDTNGHFLAIASGGETDGIVDNAAIWRISDGIQLCQLPHSGSVTDVTINADAARVATASMDRTARIWDLKTGTQIGSPLKHRDTVAWARFSRDGRYVITCEENGKIQAWNPESGELLSPDLSHSFGITLLLPGDGIRKTQPSFSKSPVWQLDGDNREFETIEATTRLASGRILTPNGSLDTAPVKDLLRAWNRTESLAELELTSVDPSAAWHKHNAARLGDHDQWTAAMWHLQRLKQADPGYLHLFLAGEATLATKLDDTDAAVVAFTKLLELEPNDNLSRLARAVVYFRKSHWTNAAADLSQSVNSTPWDEDVWDRLLVCQLRSRDREAYARECRRMVAEYSLLAEENRPYNTLAWMCCMGPNALIDQSNLIDFANKAIEDDGRSHPVLNTLGAAYYRAGRFDEALSALDEGVKLEGNGGVIEDWLFQAMAYFQKGNVTEARLLVEKSRTWLADQSATADKDATEDRWDEKRVERHIRELLLAEATSLLDTHPELPK